MEVGGPPNLLWLWFAEASASRPVHSSFRTRTKILSYFAGRITEIIRWGDLSNEEQLNQTINFSRMSAFHRTVLKATRDEWKWVFCVQGLLTEKSRRKASLEGKILKRALHHRRPVLREVFSICYMYPGHIEVSHLSRPNAAVKIRPHKGQTWLPRNRQGSGIPSVKRSYFFLSSPLKTQKNVSEFLISTLFHSPYSCLPIEGARVPLPWSGGGGWMHLTYSWVQGVTYYVWGPSLVSDTDRSFLIYKMWRLAKYQHPFVSTACAGTRSN